MLHLYLTSQRRVGVYSNTETCSHIREVVKAFTNPSFMNDGAELLMGAAVPSKNMARIDINK